MPRQITPAVIVGFEMNGLGVARALRREGIPSISLAGPVWTPSCRSWTSEVVMSSGWNEEAVVSDLEAIGRRLPGKAPLLITKDEPVLWVSKHRGTLSKYFEIAMPGPDDVSLLMDKTRFHDVAMARNWPVPRTWRANTRAQVEAIANEAPYPCILKPAVKNSEFREKSPAKAFKPQNPRELLDTYEMVAAWEADVLIQEWVGGGDDRIAFALGYWNTASRNLAIFPGRKLRQWPPEHGNTALSAPAPEAWRGQLTDLTLEIFQATGYAGLGSIEYKVAPDGRLVIMEPTVGRTNYQNEVAVLNGVNLPAIAYYDGMGIGTELERVLAQAERAQRVVKLIDAMADYRSARIYISRGQLDWGSWLRSRKGPKRDMLYRLSDPAPALVAYFRAAASFVKHRILKPVLRPLLAR